MNKAWPFAERSVCRSLRNVALAGVCLFSISACAWIGFGMSENDSIQNTVTGTDQAVQQFLTGRELDPIEGAWVHDENAFEIVIARNNFDIAEDYEYVGIITRSDVPRWQNGDIKLVLQSTETEGVFDGLWTTRNNSKKRMRFVIEHRNLVQASFVSIDGNAYFVRIRRINPGFARAH